MRGRLALAALLLAGCRPGTETPAPASPAPVVADAKQVLNDEALAAAVRARLALDSGLQGLHISVEASGGRVRLRGAAPDTSVRARIGAIAQDVEGVTVVVNEVSVQLRPS